MGDIEATEESKLVLSLHIFHSLNIVSFGVCRTPSE
jgi:hypothetical protein